MMDDIGQRVEELEVKVAEVNKGNNTADFSACLSEMEDRMNRSKNVIIFGVEDNDALVSNVENKDKEFITRLLSLFNSTTESLKNFKTWRIGSISQVKSVPRPLKVIFQCAQDANHFRTCFLNLKSGNQTMPFLISVTVAPDRTKIQQLEYRQVKKELSDRLERGETDLKIRYRRGSPVIMNSRKPTTSVNKP